MRIFVLTLTILVVGALATEAAYSVGCFPANERHLETINIVHNNWTTSRLSAAIARIFLEEKLGFRTTDTELVTEQEVFDRLHHGTADIFLEANPVDVGDLIEQFVTVERSILDVGPLGVYQEFGWYIPDYVWNVSNVLDTYTGFFSDESVIALFHLDSVPVDFQLENITLISAFKSIDDVMASAACNSTLNATVSVTDCKAAIEGVITFMRNEAHLNFADDLVPLWTMPDSYETLDATIIRNLGLSMEIVVPIPSNLDKTQTEEALVELLRDSYAARKPFISYFWEPQYLFSHESPVKLRRVQLPDYDADYCNISSSNYRCEYQPNVMRKMVSSKLPAKNEIAFDLAKVLHYDENELEDMLGRMEYDGMSVDQAACNWVLNNFESMETLLPDPSRLVTPSEVNGSLRIAFVILAALLIAFFCVLAAGTFHYRRVRVVLSASPVFLMLMLLGAAWSMFWVILLYDDAPTDAICIARIWARHLGFSLVFGALALKTYRIAAIFNVKATKKSHQLTNVRLLVRFGEINLYVCAFLLTWTVAGAPTATTLVSHNNSYAVCSITWWDNAMYLQELAAMLGLAFLSYRVRKAPSAFNECKHMALAVYNWIIIGVILQLILNSTTGTADFYFAIQSLEVLVPVPIAILLLFVPKFYLTLRGKGSEVTTSSFRGSNPNGSHPKTPSDPSNSNAKAASGDMEMSSGNGVDSETGRPELSGKAAAAEYKNIRRENIRLMREMEAMRTQLLRLHNPHSGTVEVM
ncbi:hypothetical protein CAOG_08457 [Capsaspora owczarzaki ATCC 30864]|uniref:hypothetical protein n=1 Tax=Capsaspora owczarzaki (strain ATCC 30864) TaxID=595528 RepID=UPI0003524C4E|nr:hypothetical protein CAOG_08457 [Capsaspora owczarzaki ATCC 30864]|eukprot:XP_011270029.1 hypothetical protein CAOG_08457 [Capsaspora owczarzaki ATCC 30864]